MIGVNTLNVCTRLLSGSFRVEEHPEMKDKSNAEGVTNWGV